MPSATLHTDELVFLNSLQVRQRYGKVSDMTPRRWQQTIGFPAPVYFGARRYWKLSDLESWERRRAVERPPLRPAEHLRKPPQESEAVEVIEKATHRGIEKAGEFPDLPGGLARGPDYGEAS